MKLENQVTSLKPSKKLEKLGVKQESLWCWVKHESQREFSLMQVNFPRGYTNLLKAGIYEIYSAFTVAELGERFKKIRQSSGYSKRFNNSYACVVDGLPGKHGNEDIGVQVETDKKNEANARAKMLIYLIENDLIKEK